MPQILPFQPSIPNYTVSVVLGTVEYVFQVRWNARDGAWYFDLLDDTLDQIYSGVKIVLGAYLAARCSDPRWLAAGGILVATDTSNQGLDAGIDDLGARVQVVFYTIAEMQEVIATGTSSTPV
jgi:hypothetical protein